MSRRKTDPSWNFEVVYEGEKCSGVVTGKDEKDARANVRTRYPKLPKDAPIELSKREPYVPQSGKRLRRMIVTVGDTREIVTEADRVDAFKLFCSRKRVDTTSLTEDEVQQIIDDIIVDPPQELINKVRWDS